MSTSELIAQLAKLGRSDRAKVWQKLEELELADTEESPETLAAIDAGRLSVREGKTHTAEEARALVAKWTTKSS